MAGIDVQHPVSFNGSSLNTDVTGSPRYTFWLETGFDELPEVRGEDSIIPSAAGRTLRDRKFDYRVIEIVGWVMGTGATEALMRTDHRTAMNSLRTLFDPTQTAKTLTVGLDNATVGSITCRPRNMVIIDKPSPTSWFMSVEFEAVSDWSIA